MRHRKSGNKLSRPLGQRKALVKSLLKSIIINERIRTTTPKAKLLKANLDKIITVAKGDNLSARRRVFNKIGNHALVKKLFDEIAPRFKDTGGGYCRLYNLGFRKSDGASLSQIELTKIGESKQKKKKQAKKKEKPTKKEPEVKGKKEKEAAKEKGLSGLKKMFKRDKKS